MDEDRDDEGVVILEDDDILEEIDIDDMEQEADGDNSDVDDDVYMPERDDAFIVFPHHEKAVLSCAIHPKDSNVVVTSGMDDKAIVWDASKNGAPIKVLAHSKESIDCVLFSKDGEYLSTADLDGNVNIYKGDTFDHLATVSLSDNFQWMAWNPISTNLIIAANASISSYSFPFEGDGDFLNYDHSVSQGAGCIFRNGLRLAAGLEDGSLRVIDLKSKAVIKTVKPFTKPAEENSIISVDVHQDNVTIICGCLGGTIFQAHADSGKFTTFPSPTGENENVESIKFSIVTTPQKLAASGHGSGALRIWDTSRQLLRHQHQFPSGITTLLWHSIDPLVFTAHLMGNISVFDARAGTVVREFLGHSMQCLSIALSSDCSLLVSTSDDKTARAYKLNEVKS